MFAVHAAAYAVTGESQPETKIAAEAPQPLTATALDEAVWTFCAFVAVMGGSHLLQLFCSAPSPPPSRSCEGKSKPKLAEADGRSISKQKPQPAAPTASVALPSAAPPSHASTLRAPAQAASPLYRRRASAAAASSFKSTEAQMPETDALAAAVRNGRAGELPRLLDEALAIQLRRSSRAAAATDTEQACTKLLLSSLRACAAWRKFQEALTAYDHMSSHIGAGSAGIWSLLLYSAVEVNKFERCEVFFDKLLALAVPSNHDFLNMARYYAHHRDLRGLQVMLADLQQRGCKVDTLSRNRALAACCKKNALELAEAILASGICAEGAEVIAFNTLIKGYADARRPARCFQLYQEMRERGVEPSKVTFGILLDTCNGLGELERARAVFADLVNSGLRLNTVHYTTFMKGLLSADHIDDAAAVLQLMSKSPHTVPDLMTYSMLVKAHADRGNVAEAMRTLELALRQGIEPDEILLNIVLSGCCVKPMSTQQIFAVLKCLMRHGLSPTTVTLSILVKALVKSEAWDEALQLLERAQIQFEIAAVEARLFVQLAQAYARAGQSRRVLSAYAAMVKVAAQNRRRVCIVTEASSAQLLQLCTSGEPTEGAAQDLHAAVLEANASSEPGLARGRLVAAAEAAAAAAAAAE